MKQSLREELTRNLLDTASLGESVDYGFLDGSSECITVRIYDNFEVYSEEDGDIRVLDKAVGISSQEIPSPLRGETIKLADGTVYEIGRQQAKKSLLGIYPLTKQ